MECESADNLFWNSSAEYAITKTMLIENLITEKHIIIEDES